MEAEPVSDPVAPSRGINPGPINDNFLTPLMAGLRDWIQGMARPASGAVPAGVSAANESSASAGYSGAFSLKIKTREGDTVTIRFDERRMEKDQESVQRIKTSYVIEGDISEAEREALDKVMEKMIGITVHFFQASVVSADWR